MLEVKLHDIGEGLTEGEIIGYFVQVGDHVTSDQPLVEVQTDKMTAEIPSPASGTVTEILFEEGDQVTVGTTLLKIDAGKENTKTKKTKQSAKKAWNTVKNKEKIILAAPYTRKIARENDIDLALIDGTGPGGRITDEDVYRFMNQAETEPAAKTLPLEIPFKGRRKQIAANMVKSFYTIPHVTHFDEVDATHLLSDQSILKKQGKPLSLTAFFIKATQLTLQEYPIFNAILDEENDIIRLQAHYHIGIAVDAKEGLIVPVIHHVEQKSMMDIHQEMKSLIEKAQTNTLSRAEITGSTFTISNAGPLGGMAATPIIHYPQTGILAFHQTKKRPVVMDDQIVIRSMMNISMSFDHRTVDGATAIQFTNRLKERLEQPAQMLVELS
ncbi:dihydrolipoamide acetyltransferase family protein [Bacillus chungangensis]|uniref:Dihydrolipoamide acetyltransferase component of pyruvate dehydrogenase complex n=1 Tax=Bacillus chungangensis TaxID=587633 RepID=A0ABT9WP74_9BACI|nr:dihydrolipoamide acetyltransferase family protein [Bacillus chungangensis]MDQ0174752.1 pyruvate dehydrogenase E2 component (dihydrolipoamide acetyltransferase) [Bacillus chungangensis]